MEPSKRQAAGHTCKGVSWLVNFYQVGTPTLNVGRTLGGSPDFQVCLPSHLPDIFIYLVFQFIYTAASAAAAATIAATTMATNVAIFLH